MFGKDAGDECLEDLEIMGVGGGPSLFGKRLLQ